MARKSKRPSSRLSLLKPISPIRFVTSKGSTEIAINAVATDVIGEKAFGLSCLPTAWTVPFVVVSEEFLSEHRKTPVSNRDKFVLTWYSNIVSSLKLVGLRMEDQIIVRSSGFSEGLRERGQFYSCFGNLSDISKLLSSTLQQIESDDKLKDQRIPLVIQKYVSPISANGHLSNERRCYEESRDWLGELETGNKSFTINLRNWRERITTARFEARPLTCNLSAHMLRVLKIPATWAYENKARVHFEWVWDGRTIYLVQADQEQQPLGVDPRRIHKSTHLIDLRTKLRLLKEISRKQSEKFKKIRNVFTYKDLGLPVAPLYALDDKNVIRQLASGIVLPDLKADIAQLVRGSLVIRMDIATDNLEKAQMLPRTDELRDLESAIDWLKKRSREYVDMDEDVIFVFHNFVPAEASAFAYSSPGQRKVQIESLWGVPEGLYYFANDKYVVDTKTPRIDHLGKNKDKFDIAEQRYYKHFFIAPDDKGHWSPKVLSPPFDWRATIENKEWVKEIALQSRRIADIEKKAVSIMWFVGVLTENGTKVVFPWYHEQYDQVRATRAPARRKKTVFDKTFTIKTTSDIDLLRKEVSRTPVTLRIIRIQPQEKELLRDKNTLRLIGELSRKIGATLLLEGGVLSHAYYQLLETGAIVEVLHPFENIDDKREFNKLVRDRVSSNIEKGGEVVSKTRISGEFLLRSLREKLIEESFEALDAIDQESIVDELADVAEVIEGILEHIGANREALAQKQKRKRNKTGGFKQGIVLLDTRNPLPAEAKSKRPSSITFFGATEPGSTEEFLRIDDRTLGDLSHKMDKWTDKRDHEGTTESILRLTIPLVLDGWVAKSPETLVNAESESGIRVRISGRRIGSKIQIELSLFGMGRQLKLPFVVENSISGDGKS